MNLQKSAAWLVVLTIQIFSFITTAFAQNTSKVVRKDCGLVEFDAIIEASGIAAGRKTPGILWTFNDSGGRNRIFAMDGSGRHRGIFILAGATNRDWEDIAVGPGPEPGVSYIYVGDIGDNSSRKYTKYIYRIAEPAIDPAASAGVTTITGVETFAFQYPDGNRDAETLLVDPTTQDIYIVSKREENVHVYRAAWPQPFSRNGFHSVSLLEFICELPMNWINAGDFSPDGKGILLKTEGELYYWENEGNEPLKVVFQRTPLRLPYIREPLGEAVCWAADGHGYYTVSEEENQIPARLYYYSFRRK